MPVALLLFTNFRQTLYRITDIMLHRLLKHVLPPTSSNGCSCMCMHVNDCFCNSHLSVLSNVLQQCHRSTSSSQNIRDSMELSQLSDSSATQRAQRRSETVDIRMQIYFERIKVWGWERVATFSLSPTTRGSLYIIVRAV